MYTPLAPQDEDGGHHDTQVTSIALEPLSGDAPDSDEKVHRSSAASRGAEVSSGVRRRPRRGSSLDKDDLRIVEDVRQHRAKKDSANFNHTTIDWLRDQSKYRRFCKFMIEENKTRGRWGRLVNLFDKCQGWLVLCLVAIFTALTAALIHTSTEWVLSIRTGYCSLGWYLNRHVCCIDSTGPCLQFVKWSDAALGSHTRGSAGAYWLNFFLYIVISTGLATSCAWLVRSFSRQAAGSGLPEMKTILGGFIIKGFLGRWTLLVKSIGLVLSVGAGLNIGKEGPLVHVSSCWGNIFTRYFSKFSWNQAKKREVFSACAAAGVSAAFGAPLGGVLFSLEAVSSFFPYKTMWRSFFCATFTTLIIQYADPFSTGKLVQFQVQQEYTLQWYELIPFSILGAIGGVTGALFIWMNLKVRRWRQRTAWLRDFPIREVALVGLVTSVLNYPNIYVRGSSSLLLQRLFTYCNTSCPSVWEDPDDPAYELCSSMNGRNLGLLVAAFLSKTVLLVYTFGTAIPTGLFIPSLSGGACVGRVMGWLIEEWYRRQGNTFPFHNCNETDICVNPAVYAIVGAAAVLGGSTRLSISLAVIMFELTGSLSYIIPIMVAVTVSKWVGDAFGSDGIYDAVTLMHGYPYIDPKWEVDFRAHARQVMSDNPVWITCYGETLASLERVLERNAYHGFPIVTDRKEGKLFGYITRGDLKLALAVAQDEVLGDHVRAHFSAKPPPFASPTFVDFSGHVDQHPTIVTPNTPADRLLDLVKALGLSYILVCHQGHLEGIIKKKDLLRHIDQSRAAQHRRTGRRSALCTRLINCAGCSGCCADSLLSSADDDGQHQAYQSLGSTR